MKKIWKRIRTDGWLIKKRVCFFILQLLGKYPLPQRQWNRSAPKVIYLTFDDGPGRHTGRLLDVLRRYNVKASFFVTKTKADMQILSRIVSEGHSLGNHTANHYYKSLYAHETAFLEALKEMEQIILEKSGVRPTLFRFPGGTESICVHSSKEDMTQTLIELVRAQGYQYYDWDLDSRDTAEAQTPGAVYNNIISGVRKRQKTIVLQHDVKKFSVDAVESVIVWGLKNGYTFLPLDADRSTESP